MSLVVAALGLAIAVPAQAQRPNQGEDESQALVDEGRAALRSGALDRAAKALDQAIALNPRRLEAYVLRSAVFAARKQYRDGIELMRRAQALAPTDQDVLTALGSQLVLSGDTADGVPLLEQVVKRDPARYDAQLLLGGYRYAGGQWPAAIDAFETYFQHRPAALAKEDARHRVDLADAYLRYHQPDKALALFREAFSARPADVRARIGVAWATAAIDCHRARPLLRELEPIAEQRPEVWLVDGQCALALGDSNGALERGKRYLEHAAPPGKDIAGGPSASAAAAGHALVAEAHAARGNLGEAKQELEMARQLDPARRRWSIRLAVVLRRSNDRVAALSVLDKLGAPGEPSLEPDWWIEVGECLLGSDPQAALARLAPVAPPLSGNAAFLTVFGATQLAAGQADAAIKTLDEAEAIRTTPRSKRLLADALVTVAVADLSAKDAAGAEPLLVRADQLDGSPIVWRNLGIARLALDKPKDAIGVLDRAVKQDVSPIALMLDARAHALSGDVAGARPLYERALALDKDSLEIAIDWAASELAGGDPNQAVTALERTAAAAKASPLAARHKAALAEARHAAGLAALRAGNGGRAVELLRGSAALASSLATRCDLALAAVVAGDFGSSLSALHAVTGQSCPFPPPADTQAAPILIAFTEGRAAAGRNASKALDKLVALTGKSSGPALALLNTAIRVVALEAAQDAYRNGALAQARRYLTTAHNASSRIGVDEVNHNLAVLDLNEGKLDAAIAQLDRLSPRIPEALINLGIAYERKGDHVRALDAWRRARKAGVHFAPLADWLESKERIYGEAP